MNKIIVTGALGRDAELKSLPRGKTCLNLSIAVNSGYGDKRKHSVEGKTFRRQS